MGSNAKHAGQMGVRPSRPGLVCVLLAADGAVQRASPLQPGARPCSSPAWSRSRWRLRFNKGPDSCWNYARLKARRTKAQVVFLASSAVRNSRRKKASRMRCGRGRKGRRGWEVVAPRRPPGPRRPPWLRRPPGLGRRLGPRSPPGRRGRSGREIPSFSRINQRAEKISARIQ